VSLRWFLLLLPVCALAGFGAGYVGAAREGTPAASGTNAEAARAALAVTRARPAGSERQAARAAFLERYPASWLRETWAREEVER